MPQFGPGWQSLNVKNRAVELLNIGPPMAVELCNKLRREPHNFTNCELLMEARGMVAATGFARLVSTARAFRTSRQQKRAAQSAAPSRITWNYKHRISALNFSSSASKNLPSREQIRLIELKRRYLGWEGFEVLQLALRLNEMERGALRLLRVPHKKSCSGRQQRQQTNDPELVLHV